MERLQDKAAVITGAGQGIGATIARRFAEEGADIVVAEMNPDTGPRTVAEIEERGRRGHFIQTDVGVKEQAVAGAATDAYKAFASANPDNAAKLLKLKPIPRMGDPDTDIAPVALFLASDDSAYITGNTIYADGGAHVNGAAWNPRVPDHPTP